MSFFSLKVIFIGAQAVPVLFEDGRRRRFDRIVTAGLDGPVFIIFPAALVIGITPRAGVSHLDKFARHIHADKIIRPPVLLEKLINGLG